VVARLFEIVVAAGGVHRQVGRIEQPPAAMTVHAEVSTRTPMNVEAVSGGFDAAAVTAMGRPSR